MSIRSLHLLDFPTLYRLRGESISLDTARGLTRGNPLGPLGLLAHINPRSRLYAAATGGNSGTLLGGILQASGDAHARLLYLAPVSRLEDPDLPALIEDLSAEAAAWGAFYILAELDEDSPAFPGLRRAGFAAYARQRVWDVSVLAEGSAVHPWQRVRSVNVPAIQNLHHQIVPPLLQPIEPAPRKASGFLCDQGALCYAGVSSGLNGIVVFPLIHPDATEVSGKLRSLVQCLPNRGGRPVYLCVRTYQAWLERVLEDLGARPGPQQAVMVKHMTRMVKEEQAVRSRQPSGASVQPSRMSRFESRSRRER